MSTQQTADPRRSPTWMRVLLAVSLAINLAVVGLVVGISLRQIGSKASPPSAFGGAMIRALPAQDRKMISKRAREILPPAADRRPERQELLDALRAVPHDASATQAYLAAQNERRQAWVRAIEEAWLERVSAMTDEERQSYATQIEEVEQRRADQRKNRASRNESKN